MTGYLQTTIKAKERKAELAHRIIISELANSGFTIRPTYYGKKHQYIHSTTPPRGCLKCYYPKGHAIHGA